MTKPLPETAIPLIFAGVLPELFTTTEIVLVAPMFVFGKTIVPPFCTTEEVEPITLE